MQILTPLLDNLQQHVFVVDPATGNITYVNAPMMRAYTRAGFTLNAASLPRPCHELLCGTPRRCATCSLKHLKHGDNVTQVRFNPVLNEERHCQIYAFNTDEGLRCLIISESPQARFEDREILERKYAKRIIQNYITDTANQDPESTDSAMRQLEHFLRHFASLFEAEHASIVRLFADSSVSIYGQWSEYSLSSHQDQKQRLHSALIPVLEKRFKGGEDLIYFDDAEGFKRDYPLLYGMIDVRQLNNIAVAPIFLTEGLFGFLTLANFAPAQLNTLKGTLALIANFVIMLTMNSRLHERLEFLSYRDQLTGLYNRHALNRLLNNRFKGEDVAVIYCDITGLKPVNDAMGHEEGDKLIVRTADILRQTFLDKQIYRVGGDEFLLWTTSLSREQLNAAVASLKENFVSRQCNVAVGSAFGENWQDTLTPLMAEADKSMYVDKKLYYTSSLFARDKRESEISQEALKVLEHFYVESLDNTAFAQYIKHNYYSAATLFKTLSHGSLPLYLCFGDPQRNVFYVSDRFREDFGFESNLVPDLFTFLEDKLVSAYDRRVFRRTAETMLRERQEESDLHLRFRDGEDHQQWIHWHGSFLWEEGEERPVFYAGYLIAEEDSQTLDSVTGLPGPEAARMELIRRTEAHEHFTMVVFAPGNFRTFNDERGREFSNHLLCEIVQHLSGVLDINSELYRLEGLTFLVILSEESARDPVQAIRNIVTAVKDTYRAHTLPTARAVSAALLSSPENGTDADVLLNHAAFCCTRAQKNPATQLYLSPENEAVRVRQDELLHKVEQAFDKDYAGLSLRFNPLVSALTRQIGAIECRLAFTDHRTTYSEADFMPLLAQSPLLDKAVRYYLRHIARLSSHGANYSTGFGIYTSPLYFEYAPDTFLEYLQALLFYRHIDPSVVHVDVPLRFTQLPRYRDAIHNLRKSGFSLSLDGWGHDSLNLKLLHDFDCDEVRLTPSLSLQDLDSSDRKALLEATLYACRAFKKRIRLTGIHNQALFSRFAGQSDLLLEGEYFKGPFPLHDLFLRLAVTFQLPEGNN